MEMLQGPVSLSIQGFVAAQHFQTHQLCPLRCWCHLRACGRQRRIKEHARGMYCRRCSARRLRETAEILSKAELLCLRPLARPLLCLQTSFLRAAGECIAKKIQKASGWTSIQCLSASGTSHEQHSQSRKRLLPVLPSHCPDSPWYT